jgi:threonine/homoserine/homoserine lactone efflux protein
MLPAMPFGSFAAFAAVDIFLVLTPGADWAFAIAAGLKGRRIVASVAGLAGGYVVQAALVTAGVGALLARNAGALSVLTLFGAAYWCGWAAASRGIPRHSGPTRGVGAPRSAPACVGLP